MNKHEKHSEQPSKQAPNWLIWGLIIFAFIGFLDASYLTVSHYTGADVNCSIVEGCNEVLSSKYSMVFGIPMALLGLLHYLNILILSLVYLDGRSAKVLKAISLFTGFGFLFSIWLVYLQLAVIEEICQYCMVSAINSVFLVALGWKSIKYWKK